MTYDEMFGPGELDKAIAAVTFDDDVPMVIEGYGDPRNNWPPGNLEWCVLNVTWKNAILIMYCRPDMTYFVDGVCFANGDPTQMVNTQLGMETIRYLTNAKLMELGIDQGLREVRFDCMNEFADAMRAFWDIESVDENHHHFVAPLSGGWDSKIGVFTKWARAGCKPEDTPEWLT